MEGLFETTAGAPIVLIGQPDLQNGASTIPLPSRGVLSFLTYRRWEAVVKGLNDFPATDWPDNIRCSITAITSWSAWEPSSSR